MYKLTETGVKRLSDNVDIPNNSLNRDWRKYQQWLAEGNIPESMDIFDPWIALRQERNLILQSTDWTQLSDVSLTTAEKAAWKEYRQKLRDLPQDYPDANKISWPDKSGLVKTI